MAILRHLLAGRQVCALLGWHLPCCMPLQQIRMRLIQPVASCDAHLSCTAAGLSTGCCALQLLLLVRGVTPLWPGLCAVSCRQHPAQLDQGPAAAHRQEHSRLQRKRPDSTL